MAKFDFTMAAELFKCWNASTNKVAEIVTPSVPEEYIADNYIQISSNDFLNELESSMSQGDVMPVSVAKKLIHILMTNEELSDAIISESLKAAVSQTCGTEKFIFKAAQSAWKELNSGYGW